MTVDEVKARVAGISALADDDEAAHAAEDELHADVLAAIRDGGCDNPRACAGTALETLKIEFSRWYA